MTKEELLPLFRENRPKQHILEIIDFRISETEGVLYDVDAILKWYDHWTDESGDDIVYDLPYPLDYIKKISDEKNKQNLEKLYKTLNELPK